MIERVKKVVLSLSVIVLFLLFALQKHPQSLVFEGVDSQTGLRFTPVPSTRTSSSSASASESRPAADVTYRDGTYSGGEFDAVWGFVNVQVTITAGKISDVQVLESPNHRSLSRSINRDAVPVLIKEAIQSQRADVDVVTGATDTSEAFIHSLQWALDDATA
jgi:uncharacterized protein with FMN-binding domain